MAASRQDLFRKLQVVEEEMDRLFSNFLGSRSCLGMVSGHVWHPPTDVYETDDAVLVYMEIPGVRQQDIEVTSLDNVLTIRGQRIDPCTEHKISVHLMEINFGHFHRRIVLPFQLHDPSAIECHLVSGFLHIRIPKQQEAPQ